MSNLTEKEVAVKIRRRMNAPVSDRLRYHPLISDGLLILAREVATDDRRDLMLTDRASTVADLDADGVCDLTVLLSSSPRILLDRLEYGEIYHTSHRDPLVWRNGKSAARLASHMDSFYLHCWLEGKKLHTVSLDANETPLANPLQLEFSVPYQATLAQLSEQLIPALIEKCCELLQENRRNYEEESDDE